MSVQKLKNEVTSQRVSVTEADTEADAKIWFDNNLDLMRGREFSLMKDAIIQLLATKKEDAALSRFVDSLRQTTRVSMLLEPPKVDVKITRRDPVRGPREAPIEIIAYFDYQ